MIENDGWQIVEQLDMTGMCYSTAKPVIDALVEQYTDQGKRVKVVARSIVEIMVASDA